MVEGMRYILHDSARGDSTGVIGHDYFFDKRRASRSSGSKHPRSFFIRSRTPINTESLHGYSSGDLVISKRLKEFLSGLGDEQLEEIHKDFISRYIARRTGIFATIFRMNQPLWEKYKKIGSPGVDSGTYIAALEGRRPDRLSVPKSRVRNGKLSFKVGLKGFKKYTTDVSGKLCRMYYPYRLEYWRTKHGDRVAPYKVFTDRAKVIPAARAGMRDVLLRYAREHFQEAVG